MRVTKNQLRRIVKEARLLRELKSNEKVSAAAVAFARTIAGRPDVAGAIYEILNDWNPVVAKAFIDAYDASQEELDLSYPSDGDYW